MIESLNGLFETVNYKQGTSLKLYNNDEYEDYPACIESPYLISVAATKEDGKLVSFSNYGEKTVDVAARPGEHQVARRVEAELAPGGVCRRD